MNVFDQRHKWGPVKRDGVMISRTCRVCGRTDTYETFIPDAFLDEVWENLTRTNIYRAMFR